MSGQGKPSDAEEIFSEFEKTKSQKEKLEEPPQKEPEPELESIPDVSEEEIVQTVESEQETVTDQEIRTEETEVTEESKTRNVIFVGTKPIMIYVTATLTQLASSPTVTIKARGKRITQAVDVSQMIVKRMDSVGYTVSDVRISSDSLTSQDGKKRNVSTIEIDVTKNENN